MAIYRPDSYIENYRLSAAKGHLPGLSGRGDEGSTKFIAQKITEKLELKATDILVDVGCGDGTLLSVASGRIREGIGICPTAEEIDFLKNKYSKVSNLRFQQGVIARLPFADGFANHVVCNSVLFELERDDIKIAIGELVRIAKAGGKIWIGEVPVKDEALEIPHMMPKTVRLLYPITKHFYSHMGFWPGLFFRRLTNFLRAIFDRNYAHIIRPKLYRFFAKDAIEGYGCQAGCELEWSMPHVALDYRGKPRDSVARFDFLFRKL